jgi:hypothetical protein
VKALVYKSLVSDYVFRNNLVEKVYRDDTLSFDHVLLPTNNENIFIVIVIDLRGAAILGHYRLDLAEEYGLS